MTDRSQNPDSQRDLLWMFRQTAAGRPREVAFDPADAIYHLYRQTRNPYLERALAPAAHKLDRTPADLQRLFRLFDRNPNYRVAPSNAEAAHTRRGLEHPAPPPTVHPGYVVPRHLPGDLRRLPWMVDVFFRAVLQRLREHPGQFREAVQGLIAQFQEEGVQIKLYEAYQTFQDWEDLMHTLEEIARFPAPDTFDLFCSALFTYYTLAYPPQSA